MKTYLKEDDRKKLVELYKTTQTTPVICFNSSVALAGRDPVSLAFKEFTEFLDKLGKDYGFDPAVCAINLETGEVKIVEEGK